MGCVASKKLFCPLCREQSRLRFQYLCDKCSFVREYTILHGREGLRHALRNAPYDARSLGRGQSSSSFMTRSNTVPNDSYNPNARFSAVNKVGTVNSAAGEPTAPPPPAPAYYAGQVLREH